MAKFKKGDKVEIINDPYTGMLGDVVGKVGTITSAGDGFVGLKWAGGNVKGWMVVDGHGKTSIKKLGKSITLPPLSGWKKKTMDGSHAGIGIQKTYTWGNLRIFDEEGSNVWEGGYAKKPDKYGYAYASFTDVVHSGSYGFHSASGNYVKGTAGKARVLLQEWVDKNPDKVVAGKPYHPKKKGKKGSGAVFTHSYKKDFSVSDIWEQIAYKAGAPKSSGPKPGYGKSDTVRLKIVGGDTTHALYTGPDSKGRARYELIPPTGKTARDVAREFKKAAKAGQKVLGGTIYAIRFARKGTEYNYWKAGK